MVREKEFWSAHQSVDADIKQVDMLIQCFCEDVGIKPSEVSGYLKKDNNQMTTKLEQANQKRNKKVEALLFNQTVYF